MKTRDLSLIKEAVWIINKYHTIDYAYDTAKKLVLDALKDIESILPNSKHKDNLKTFANFVIERKI